MAGALTYSIQWIASKLAAMTRGTPPLPSLGSSSKSRSCVEEDLKQFSRTVQRIQAVLHDAEEREILDEFVKLWLWELKTVAYDAEDDMDEYEYELLRLHIEGGRAAAQERKSRADEEVNALPTTPMAEPLFLADMAERIRANKYRFDEIADAREKLQLREEDGVRHWGDLSSIRLPSSSFVDESAIRGREDDKERVIDMLLSEDSSGGDNISVLPIVGMGGLGKTTLAQLVYNDPRVCRYFSARKWVCVSEKFDLMRLTEAIVKPTTAPAIELDHLQGTLREELRGQTTLIVLDDVWNDKPRLWESFRAPLVGVGTVKIVVTTRDNRVARIMQTMDPYNLGFLAEDKCWWLFQQCAFGDLDPKGFLNLVKIGKQIVKKCGGLPLAVKALGGLLRCETDEERWKDVLQSHLWEVDDRTEILPALRLSYNRMPTHLKPCFLFCSLFPKGKLFKEDEMIRLWMAQGYIQSRGSKRMEDMGHEYFNELHSRSFVQAYPDTSDGIMFGMHDVIHDLAQSVAGEEFAALVPKDDQSPHYLSNHVHHLYVGLMRLQLKDRSLNELTGLRTLFLNHYCDNIIHNHLLSTIFRRLRVLHVKRNGMLAFPDSIGSLKHLRYLGFESWEITRLPDAVCYLYNLQTLDLGDCWSLEELPSGIGNLINLRYLDLGCTKIARLPDAVCQLDNLQTLDLNCCESLTELPTGIQNLTNLRHLDLCCTKIDRLPDGVCNLYNLHTLDLHCCECLKELPSGIGNLINLRYLDIWRTKIGMLPYTICHLCKLQTLHLMGSYVGLPGGYENIICMPPGFGRLVNLRDLSDFVVGRGKGHCGIGELKRLVNLHGELNIYGLRNVARAEDAKEANLRSMQHLQKLTLCWRLRDCHLYCKFADVAEVSPDSHFEFADIIEPVEEMGVRWKVEEDKAILTEDETAEAVLDNLQPHTEVKELKIYDFCGARFPQWMADASFSKLTRIDLCGCHNKKCEFLPSLGLLPSLKHLLIQSMGSIKRVGREFCCNLVDENLYACVGFPCLEELTFCDMPEWEEWCGVVDGDFSRLHKLVINNCPKLSTLPTLSLSLLGLSIGSCNSLVSRPLHQCLPPGCLPRLQEVLITNCLQLRWVVLLQICSSLERLVFSESPQLQLSSNECLATLHQDAMIEIEIRPGPRNWRPSQGFHGLEGINCSTIEAANEEIDYEYLKEKQPQVIDLKTECQLSSFQPLMQSGPSLLDLNLSLCFQPSSVVPTPMACSHPLDLTIGIPQSHVSGPDISSNRESICTTSPLPPISESAEFLSIMMPLHVDVQVPQSQPSEPNQVSSTSDTALEWDMDQILADPGIEWEVIDRLLCD